MLPGAPSVLSSELCHGGNWAWLAHQSLREPGAEGMNDQQPVEVVKSRIFPSQHHQDQELVLSASPAEAGITTSSTSSHLTFHFHGTPGDSHPFACFLM